MKIWEYDRRTLPKVLRTYRKEHKLSQEQFAKLCGIKETMIQAYEIRREVPILNNLVKLAQVMDIDEIRINPKA